MGLREVVWVDFMQIQPRKVSKRWQHAGKDFESKVLFVAKPTGSSLDNSDLVVEPLDEAQRDLVLLLAVGCDAIPRMGDRRRLRGAGRVCDRRPEFQRMIDAATAKPPAFDVILVHSFSRFFRDQFQRLKLPFSPKCATRISWALPMQLMANTK
jgi:hypothetical protein